MCLPLLEASIGLVLYIHPSLHVGKNKELYPPYGLYKRKACGYIII